MTKEKAVVDKVFTPLLDQPSPVLLKFQNGDLSSSHKNTTAYFPMKSRADNKRRAVVITSGNVYSGTVGEGVATELTDTYICVRNKETNKVRILPIDQVKLNNHIYLEKEKTKFATLTKENSFAVIMRTFGGRKDIRMLANRERNKVNIDVIKQQLENTIEESETLDTSELSISMESNVDRLRPPFNKDATNLESVFALEDVIPSELLGRLDEEASALMCTELDEIPITLTSLRNTIESLQKSPQSSECLLKMKIIIYMDGLQALMKTKKRVLGKLELSQITEKVENDIRERFSDPNSSKKMRTSFSNEKALCYYLVLAFLLSDKYELDMDVLSQELCVPRTKIVKFGRLVNAIPKTRTNILTLRLPSSIKPMGTGFGKRKKQ